MTLATFVSLPCETSGSRKSFAVGPHFLGFFWPPADDSFSLGGGGHWSSCTQPYQLHVLSVQMENGPFLAFPFSASLASSLLSPTPEALEQPEAVPPPTSPILKSPLSNQNFFTILVSPPQSSFFGLIETTSQNSLCPFSSLTSLHGLEPSCGEDLVCIGREQKH